MISKKLIFLFFPSIIKCCNIINNEQEKMKFVGGVFANKLDAHDSQKNIENGTAESWLEVSNCDFQREIDDLAKNNE